MTVSQVQHVAKALDSTVPSYVSMFAGRIADTGRDPVPMLKKSLTLLRDLPNSELIWASPRELLNIFQANDIGCHIITVTSEILKKFSMVGYNLDEYSLDTVKMFYADATAAGYRI
jgi:transaldolase